jgi:mRNA-degrading endonuclease toxin of MazEF toxin-antitoxin module
MNRGDVVVVPFPFQDKPGEKIRPAVVVQSDAEIRLASFLRCIAILARLN